MKLKHLILLPLLVIITLLNSGCGESDEQKTPEEPKKKRPLSWLRNIIGNFSSQDTLFIDSTYIDQFLTKYPKFKPLKPDVQKFYSDRRYAYAWYDGKGIIEQSGNLVNRVNNIEYDGLQDSLPYMTRLDDLMDRPNRKANREELELLLTAQYFSLANYVWKGLSDQEIKKLGWFIPRKKISYVSYLDSILAGSENDFLESEPVNKQYEDLRLQVKRFKELEKQAWTPIPAPAKSIKPGDSSAVIASIRERLHVLGDLSEDSKQPLYDESLKAAVVSFQERHGLEPDGIIGKVMVQELNVPVSKRLEQIAVNMERSRWVPIDYSSKESFLLVNIPEYKLHVYENGAKAWDCNVVVGERENKTVVFNGVLKYIVFSPHWNIPESIVLNEIMPSIEKDPAYLEKQDLEIVETKDDIPVIRQKPGKENSLGLVKFMFPNTHNIYLHDSPAKELFNRNERAFSHGCVRVGEPVKLAEYLLRDDAKWNSETIHEAMNGGEEKYVNLKTRVPVYMVYFTSWVDDAGKLNFRKDIYDNDSRLARTLFDNGQIAKLQPR